MQFNPTDKSNSLIAHIDFLLFGNGTVLNEDFTLVDRTRGINNAQDEIISEFFKADPNFMWDDTTNVDFPIAYHALEAGVTNIVLPDSSLVINRMRVKDTNGKYVTLEPVNRRELTDSELEATGTPNKFYKVDNALFPVPVPNYGATDGIELEFQRGANHFATTDTTRSPGFGSQFHSFLSIGASLEYAVGNGMNQKINALSVMKENMKKAIREHYESRSRDDRPQIKLKRTDTRNYGLTR